MKMRFGDNPDGAAGMIPPGGADKIMHASLRIGDTTVMASDGMCSGAASFQGFGLSIAAKSAAQAASLFAALGEGGQVRMPLCPTFFSPSFGMVADRFGVVWMVIAESPSA